ncbi:MAG: substrate-binding domain-containing protein [Firmicutes bacterium]|nr:substrate-binding domain-containing protein [Bacillota bacterium]
MKKRILALLFASVLSVSLLAGCGSSGGSSDSEAAGGDDYEAAAAAAEWIKAEDLQDLDQDQGYKIGFTDNFDGNTLHQQQEKYFENLATAMKDVGIVSDFTMVVANNDVATQVQQIESFVLDGCDLIVVDPCSSSGLDGAIENATNAGVEVIIFNDGPVSSAKCTQLNVDCVSNFGYLTDWCAQKLGGKGNVLVCRGIAGQSYDALAYEGITSALEKYPDMKIVGEVYGEYNSTTAQTEIASFIAGSKEKVDLVCGESGDAYGAAMAFQAAGLDIPLIYGGNRGEFLNWWMEQEDYETISGVATPWFSAAALFLGIEKLNGVDIPQYMYYPMDLITQEDLSKFEGIDDSTVATSEYDLSWVRSDLETQDENECKPDMIKE